MEYFYKPVLLIYSYSSVPLLEQQFGFFCLDFNLCKNTIAAQAKA